MGSSFMSILIWLSRPDWSMYLFLHVSTWQTKVLNLLLSRVPHLLMWAFCDCLLANILSHLGQPKGDVRTCLCVHVPPNIWLLFRAKLGAIVPIITSIYKCAVMNKNMVMNCTKVFPAGPLVLEVFTTLVTLPTPTPTQHVSLSHGLLYQIGFYKQTHSGTDPRGCSEPVPFVL